MRTLPARELTTLLAPAPIRACYPTRVRGGKGVLTDGAHFVTNERAAIGCHASGSAQTVFALAPYRQRLAQVDNPARVRPVSVSARNGQRAI
jgi:hypothetical protein